MTWQCNWRVWHWPWWHVTVEYVTYAVDRRHYYRDNAAGFGPFQFRWYSKHDSRRSVW